MKFIDLHVHSTMSDGTYTPKDLIKLAKDKGLSALTLSDHDTIDGLAQASTEALKTDIEFIPGMEVSTDYKGRTLHIVALGFDRTSAAFKKLYKSIRAKKENKMGKLINRLKEKGLDISVEKVKPFIYEGSQLERYAIMRYIMSLHIADKLQIIWDEYLNPTIKELGLDANISVEELAEGIHGAGGIISLAHFHKYIGLKGMSRQE